MSNVVETALEPIRPEADLLMEPSTNAEPLSVGAYLGYRLLSVGCDTVFCVPGDFNCE